MKYDLELPDDFLDPDDRENSGRQLVDRIQKENPEATINDIAFMAYCIGIDVGEKLRDRDGQIWKAIVADEKKTVTDDQVVAEVNRHNGNKTKAAKSLGITRMQLYRRIADIPPEWFE